MGAHFAKRGGPRGTTKRLELWLAALAKVINKRSVSPALVALALRFLEAPELLVDNPVIMQSPTNSKASESGIADRSNAVDTADFTSKLNEEHACGERAETQETAQTH